MPKSNYFKNQLLSERSSTLSCYLPLTPVQCMRLSSQLTYNEPQRGRKIEEGSVDCGKAKYISSG